MTIFEPVRHNLPNILTLGNLVAGSCAIAALFTHHPVATLILAILCLFLDVLDGFLARRLKTTTELGLHLDSLADLVSFGVLPGCILYFLLQAVCPNAQLPSWLPYAAFLVTAGVALRLAHYNVDIRERTVFFGLPTPGAATLIFGFLWMYVDQHQWWSFVCSATFLFSLVIILPLLMLSNIRLWSLKGLPERNGKLILFALLSVFALLMLVIGSAGVSLMVVVYIVFGIINHYLKLY